MDANETQDLHRCEPLVSAMMPDPFDWASALEPPLPPTPRARMKVLVSAASKHGATAEIARAIADVLADHGSQTTVLGADEVSTIASYDVLISLLCSSEIAPAPLRRTSVTDRIPIFHRHGQGEPWAVISNGAEPWVGCFSPSSEVRGLAGS
jgi:hypothetical protein